MCFMRIIAPLFELFFCLTIITIIFFQFYYMHYFSPKHYLHYVNYGDSYKSYNAYNRHNCNNLCIPLRVQIHESGLRLQNPGLTAGMHSYTSKAAIAAKILRNPGSRCTSVWAGTPSIWNPDNLTYTVI